MAVGFNRAAAHGRPALRNDTSEWAAYRAGSGLTQSLPRGWAGVGDWFGARWFAGG